MSVDLIGICHCASGEGDFGPVGACVVDDCGHDVGDVAPAGPDRDCKG